VRRQDPTDRARRGQPIQLPRPVTRSSPVRQDAPLLPTVMSR
jgi:hypothetical protein